jgi:hypothetical protein
MPKKTLASSHGNLYQVIDRIYRLALPNSVFTVMIVCFGTSANDQL